MNPSEARGSEPGIPVAVVQMTTGRDTAANVAQAGELVAEAARRGATLVVLPETWNLMDDADGLRGGAESLDGPSLTAARGWAAAHSVTLLAGSITERIPGSEQTFNTSVLIGPDGRDVGRVTLFLEDQGAALPIGDQPPYWGIDPGKPLALVDGKAPF